MALCQIFQMVSIMICLASTDALPPRLTVAPHETCVDACDRPSFCEDNQYAANPNNCTNYYRCLFNEWLLVECGAGTNFDTEICGCNHDYIATCQQECPTVTPRPTFQPSTCENIPTPCEIGSKYADRSSCEHYYDCLGGNNLQREECVYGTQHGTCEVGYICVFDIYEKQCRRPDSEFDCHYRCLTTAAETSATTLSLSLSPEISTHYFTTDSFTSITSQETTLSPVSKISTSVSHSITTEIGTTPDTSVSITQQSSKLTTESAVTTEEVSTMAFQSTTEVTVQTDEISSSTAKYTETTVYDSSVETSTVVATIETTSYIPADQTTVTYSSSGLTSSEQTTSGEYTSSSTGSDASVTTVVDVTEGEISTSFQTGHQTTVTDSLTSEQSDVTEDISISSSVEYTPTTEHFTTVADITTEDDISTSFKTERQTKVTDISVSATSAHSDITADVSTVSVEHTITTAIYTSVSTIGDMTTTDNNMTTLSPTESKSTITDRPITLTSEPSVTTPHLTTFKTSTQTDITSVYQTSESNDFTKETDTTIPLTTVMSSTTTGNATLSTLTTERTTDSDLPHQPTTEYIQIDAGLTAGEIVAVVFGALLCVLFVIVILIILRTTWIAILKRHLSCYKSKHVSSKGSHASKESFNIIKDSCDDFDVGDENDIPFTLNPKQSYGSSMLWRTDPALTAELTRKNIDQSIDTSNLYHSRNGTESGYSSARTSPGPITKDNPAFNESGMLNIDGEFDRLADVYIC